MKIVYVGDNRVRGNYGCRATSTALSLLVGENNEIVGRITGAHTHFDTDELFFVKGLPSWIYKLLGKRKSWKYLKHFLYLFIRMIKRGGKFYFGNCDFISHDLDQSIENLIRLIPANLSYREFDLRQFDFDALVINGEGSFIFSTPPWRESLVIAMEMHWAKKMGKKVFFMNAMFSDDPNSERNTETLELMNDLLAKCEIVVAREYMSMDYVHKYLPKANPVFYPDALFSWYDMINDGHEVKNLKYYIAHKAECDEFYYNFTFDKPYALIAASSAGIISSDMEVPIQAYMNLVKKTKKRLGVSVYLIQVCEGDEFLVEVGRRTNTYVVPMETPIVAAAKILANAKVFISGRYHPSIMASLGGTPCVFMSSNSHKTESIQNLLNYNKVYEFNVVPDEIECEKILDLVEKYTNEGDALRKSIKNRAEQLSKQAILMKELIK